VAKVSVAKWSKYWIVLFGGAMARESTMEKEGQKKFKGFPSFYK
jgi:hypothetical protein